MDASEQRPDGIPREFAEFFRPPWWPKVGAAPPRRAGTGFTFRGDAISHGNDPYHSITPSGLGQPYLVLMALASDLSLPAGETAASLQANLVSKLGPRPPQPPFPNNTANGFWWEATYQKVSFDFDVDPAVVTLPDPMATYFRPAQPKRIQAAGATYPVTFPATETLSLKGDAGFTATVSFAAGSATLAQVLTTINAAVAAAGAGQPPLRASASGGQLLLETTRAAADAVLDVTGGSAVNRLGLAAPPAVVTAGLNAVNGFIRTFAHALQARVQGMSSADAKTYLSQYAGVIVAFAGPNSLLRASATLGGERVDVLLPGDASATQFSLSLVRITTGDRFEVFAHEIGHNLGLPDLYQEPGDPVGVGTELERWDIMADSSAARHPTSWSKAYRSRDPATGSAPWMPATDLAPIMPPPGSGNRRVQLLIAPLESPLPASNPFAGQYPGALWCHGARLELEPDHSLYIENRQLGPYSSSIFGDVGYSRGLPGQGVIITDAVNSTTGLPVYRKEVVLLTPVTDPLDNPGEQRTVLVLTPTNSIRVELLEEVGAFPSVYLVEVNWGQGPYFDYRIRDWSPPPWESPDIWIDTRVDNDWDVYRHADPAANPGVLGNPVLNGDRSRVGWASRVYARVWNDGDIVRSNVRVRFQIVVPAGMGPNPGIDIGDTTINLPAGGWALAMVPWTPKSANNGHVCVRAMVDWEQGELNANNNLAQENVTDWWLQGSPPFDPVEFPFQVTNPLPRRAQVRMRARGLVPGWFLDVDPVELWLEPGETILGTARIRADATVPVEDSRDNPAPMVTLEALADPGDTWVPFGGISGTAHPVHRADLEVEVGDLERELQVTGRAWTAVGVIRGANVSLRLLADDGRHELDLRQTTTDGAGEFREQLRLGEGPDRPGFLEVVLSPTPGTGPAEAGPIRLR
jgi:hypothetical protein